MGRIGLENLCKEQRGEVRRSLAKQVIENAQCVSLRYNRWGVGAVGTLSPRLGDDLLSSPIGCSLGLFIPWKFVSLEWRERTWIVTARR